MNIVTNYIRSRLADHGITGHNDLNVYWSLGHCQGDGIAFAHERGDRLTDTAVRGYIERHYRGAGVIRFTLLRALTAGISLHISQDGRYYHEQSMQVTADTDAVEGDEQANAVEDLAKTVNKAIVDISREIRDEAYEILGCLRFEDQVVREFRTPRYLLQVKHCREELEWLDFDPETIDDLAAGLVEEVCRVEVSIIDADPDGNEDVLAEHALGNVVLYKAGDHRYYREIVRELVNEACSDVRDTVTKPQQPMAEAA